MKDKGLILLLTLLVCSMAEYKQEGILALSWFGGFCDLNNDCTDDAMQSWDHQSFTIHGLWPNSKAEDRFGKFNNRYLPSDLREDLFEFWPPSSRHWHSDYFLWSYEYNKHGSDYAQILLEYNRDNFSPESHRYERNKQLQIQYFKDTIELYKSLRVRKIPQSQYSKSAFGRLLNLRTNMFFPVCNKDGTLLEIRICVVFEKNGGIQPTRCRRFGYSKGCRDHFRIVLSRWQKKTSYHSPVFA